jgi:hypothetical protein
LEPRATARIREHDHRDENGTTVTFDSQPGAAQDAPVTTVIDGGNIKVQP